MILRPGMFTDRAAFALVALLLLAYSTNANSQDFALSDGLELQVAIGEASFEERDWLSIQIKNVSDTALEKSVNVSVKIRDVSFNGRVLKNGAARLESDELAQVFSAKFNRLQAGEALKMRGLAYPRSGLAYPRSKAKLFANTDLGRETATATLEINWSVADTANARRCTHSFDMQVPNAAGIRAVAASLKDLAGKKEPSLLDRERLFAIAATPFFLENADDRDVIRILEQCLLEDFGQHSRHFSSLKGIVLPFLLKKDRHRDTVKSMYETLLRDGPIAVVDDLATYNQLWDARFTEPLIERYKLTRMFRNKILSILETNKALDYSIRKSLADFTLEELGCFGNQEDFDPLRGRTSSESQQLLHVFRVVRDRRFVSMIANHLNDKLPAGTNIGGSLPLGDTLPTTQLGDCVHDTIVTILGGNLEARIAVAYQQVGITNEFDPGKLLGTPRYSFPLEDAAGDGRSGVPVDGDVNEAETEVIVTVDGSETRKLFNEVRLVRDQLLKNLQEDLEKIEREKKPN